MKFWSFMASKTVQKETSTNKVEFVITRVLETRNNFIKRLLSDEFFSNYLQAQFGVTALSQVRQEFLKRALKEHLNSPLDLVHYSSLIKDLRASDSSFDAPIESPLFDLELLPVFKKYISI